MMAGLLPRGFGKFSRGSFSGEGQLEDGLTVDQALERVQFGRGQYFGMTVNMLIAMSDSMQLVAVFYLTKALGHDWGAQPDALAWLDGGLLLGAAAGVLAGGWAADIYGRKPITQIAAALSIVTGAACGWANDFSVLLVLRIAVGVALGFNDSASLAMTLEAVPAQKRGKAVLLVQGLGGATGKILMTVLAELLYDHGYNPQYSRFGWRAYLVAAIIPSTVALVLSFYVLNESPRWLAVHGRTGEASVLLRNLSLRNGTSDRFPKGTRILRPEMGDDDAVDDVDSHSRHLGRLDRLRKEPMHTMVVLCSAAMMCANFVYFGLMFALPVYLEAAGYKEGWDRQFKSTVLIIVAVSEAPALWICYGSLDWKDVGRSNTVVWSLIGCAVSTAIFNFQLLTIFLNTTNGIIITNFLARGFVSAAVITIKIYVAEIFPTMVRAAAIAISECWGRLGGAIAPILVGFLMLDIPSTDLGMWTRFMPLRVYVLFTVFSGVAAYLVSELGVEPSGQSLPDSTSESLGRVDSKSALGQLVATESPGATPQKKPAPSAGD